MLKAWLCAVQCEVLSKKTESLGYVLQAMKLTSNVYGKNLMFPKSELHQVSNDARISAVWVFFLL